MTTILFIGDIVGRTGREAVRRFLPELKERFRPDTILANCENLAHGFGITRDTIDEMSAAGIDVFTSGNHVFDRKEGATLLEDLPYVLRPMNYPPEVPGRGYRMIPLPDQRNLTVVSLMGRAFMTPLDCPFRSLDRLLESGNHDLVLVDFHAEATAEKAALAHAFDGRVTAVLGTHTHVQTADERILPGGTAFMTDVGMTGAIDSVIGVQPKEAIRRMRTGLNERLIPAKGRYWLAACRITITDRSAVEIERLLIRSDQE